MGTKNKPGTFDCYANAKPDEPMFVLLARDPFAPILVRLWADLREHAVGNPSKVLEARTCAIDMEKWRLGNREEPPSADAVAKGAPYCESATRDKNVSSGAGVAGAERPDV